MLSIMTILIVISYRGFALNEQKIPALPDAPGISAFLIKPSQGMAKMPAGWKRNTDRNFSNSQLALEYLTAVQGAAPYKTISETLPKAHYTMFILAIGKGRARVGGGDWKEINVAGNYYQWVKLGKSKKSRRVTVEVKSLSPAFKYAGLLAAGDRLPIISVARVMKKLRRGEPVTIALVGDSVTENAKGHRGGSTSFEKGNPGLFKAMLEKEFDTPVAYASHREPSDWPENPNATKFKRVTLDKVQYRDGRVEVDPSAKIRLINMGKGGAASDDGWHRFPDTFTEVNAWHKIKGQWLDIAKTDLQPILRWGLTHYRPDLVIINFGTNDANGSHKGRTAKDYLFFMKILATMTQHRLGAAVILSTPHKWTRGTHQMPHTQPEMTDIIRLYAQKTGFRLADIYNEYEPDNYDGIHPHNKGHFAMASAYMKALLNEPSKAKTGSGATAAQFKDNGDGTVTDTFSGLMWLKNANVAGKTCSFYEAREIIARVNHGGHSDWRLPTRDELLSLVAFSRRRPSLPAGHPFANVGRWYLSTTDERGYHYGVDFDTGVAYFPAKREMVRGFVWPVRNRR
jgi:lysophospholipase L1-like esterase